MSKAKVNPHQPWPERGNADVVPLDNPIPVGVVLPVEQREPGAYTIKKSEYPNGVVLVNPNFTTTPPKAPVEWTLMVTDDREQTLGPGWADGIVVLFTR